MDKKVFCESIRRIRREENLTLDELSERSGVNAGQLSRIENGHFPNKITTIVKLQTGLSLTNTKMMMLLGFKVKGHRAIPVISPHVTNFGKALANAPTISFLADYTPKHAFIVKADHRMSALIPKHSYTLVNRDFDYHDGKIYAILLKHQILIGRVYKSKGHSYGVLVANHKSYFNVDYRDQFRVLGQVVRIIDNV